MQMDTDLTFFTNNGDQTLLSRFKATLKDTSNFDILVGYFNSSGFYQLSDSIEDIQKTRILIGLGIDREAHQVISSHQDNLEFDFESHRNTKRKFRETLSQNIESSSDPEQFLEIGIRKFVRFLNTDCHDVEFDISAGGNGKKLEFRVFPAKNLHAKVYIGRFDEEDRDFGFVITGSSNFSYSGLLGNREFNVELRKRGDVEFALSQFEELWQQSVDVSDEFVEAINTQTWLNNSITPYELYLKLIYEYLQEDINLSDEIEVFLPEGFMRLEYQRQAVIQALKKLKEHNGVFLADVVGLGKTFIAAQLLQQLRGRILVICPPVLKNYWRTSLQDFGVPAHIESLGKLESLINEHGTDRYDYIVVDESHRFRNEATQAYANLLDICRGKKVILVTATPLNNTIDDIYAQLKLFQPPKNSSIPGIPDLDKFFNSLRKRFKNLDRTDPEYRTVVKAVSSEIRDKILKHVIVRRTRTDVKNHFTNDMDEQGLSFPSIADPRKIVYQFDGQLEAVFNDTILALRNFRYARYIPLLYYTGKKQLTEFERQQQRNVGSFMKGILIKRLESSVHAFRKSVDRFIVSYEKFLEMFDAGTVYISQNIDVFDLIANDDTNKLGEMVEEELAHKYASVDFRDGFRGDLAHDLETLKAIKKLWATVKRDPKLEAFQQALKADKDLAGKRLIIFTESKETGEYLFKNLNSLYPDQVMFFSSQGGRIGKASARQSPSVARNTIMAAFDPGHKNPIDNPRILITTDVLAEGINLHRGNVLINYDLPWNPTRVLQRAGRINRLGTSHPELFIYNIFPTTQSDEHLGLEANITNKIQMFHHILGEDARYLSDGEEIGSQELFHTLNKAASYTGEDEGGDPELRYLAIIREIRNSQPELFEKIKNLPKKARSGRQNKPIKNNQLLTFFRLGNLKKFYLNAQGSAEEITFFEAAQNLECEPDTPRAKISDDYFHLLETNRQKFETDTRMVDEPSNSRGGRSNVKYIEGRLKEKHFKSCKVFTEADDDFIATVRKMISQGTLAKKRAQLIKKAFEKTIDPLEVLVILRKYIPDSSLPKEGQRNKTSHKREVILSAYLLCGER